MAPSHGIDCFLDAIAAINSQLAVIEKRLKARHKAGAQSRRVATIPGIRLIGATAFAARVNGQRLSAPLFCRAGVRTKARIT